MKIVFKQGDIIKTNFSPQAGHEQAGLRPAVVVSCKMFNKTTQMPVVCPITNTNRPFPFHVMLDDRTETTGVILCEQIKTVDLDERGVEYVEELPQDLLQKVLNVVQRAFAADAVATDGDDE